MINCTDLYNIFKRENITFFSGVPDSTFKDWMSFLADNDGVTNIIASNECEATAVCTGYHLATGKTAVAYMQNSGLGKVVNPITSLADPDVYSIPILLMIGWRGEPGKKDEPQHVKMGKVMIPLLETLGIEHTILSTNVDEASSQISAAQRYMKEHQSSYALIIKNGVMEKYQSQSNVAKKYTMKREDAIQVIVDALNGDEIIVSTTGKTSRELFEYRAKKETTHRTDFYTVGSMGCASAIAFGIATETPDKKVLVFDGDGAAIMQLGSLATIGHYRPSNLIHFLFDNGCHESTGGQPTVSLSTNFEDIAKATGYRVIHSVKTKDELEDSLKSTKLLQGPAFICVKIKKGSRDDLGRPTLSPVENKIALMSYLASLK